MRVAFDCQGTLLGGGDKVVELYKWFESRGCEMIIWSNGSFMEDAKKAHSLEGLCVYKTMNEFNNDEKEVDIAIDDDGWFREEENIPLLSTKHLIDVDDIPEDNAKFEEMFGYLLKG